MELIHQELAAGVSEELSTPSLVHQDRTQGHGAKMRLQHPLKCFSYDPKGGQAGSDPAEVRTPDPTCGIHACVQKDLSFLSLL